MTATDLDELIDATRVALLKLTLEDKPSSYSVEGQSESYDVTGLRTQLEGLLKLRATLFPFELRSVAV